jgi:hypothetical protein
MVMSSLLGGLGADAFHPSLTTPSAQKPLIYQPYHRKCHRVVFSQPRYSDESDPNPVFPPTTSSSSSSSFQPISEHQQQPNYHPTECNAEHHQQKQEEQHQGNTRFSKFAPSLDLSTEEFRKQLKENMKQDLERRRRQDPNRGNQPAKSYLDSL